MHFAAAIIRAIMQKRFADARKLKLQKTKPGYETSEALSDEVRPRLEHLQALLTTRLDELIDDREIVNFFLDSYCEVNQLNYNLETLRIFSIISINWPHISQLSIFLSSINSSRRVVRSV